MRAAEAALRLLGLAARAGAVVPGTARVRDGVRAGMLDFVVVASDASAHSRQKLVPLLDARRLPYVVAFTRAELGGAVGRAPLSAVGVNDRSLAGRLRDVIPGAVGR